MCFIESLPASTTTTSLPQTWKMQYSVCDVDRGLVERNLEGELQRMKDYAPSHELNDDKEELSFGVKDPRLSEILDGSYNDHINSIKKMMSEYEPMSRMLNQGSLNKTVCGKIPDARKYASVVTLEATNSIILMGKFQCL